MKFTCLLLFFLSIIFCSADTAEKIQLKLPDVIVVGSVGERTVGRFIDSYTTEEIINSQTYTIDEIINRYPLIDLKTRGVSGAQQDLGMLGSGYEQALVLYDGIPVNDPQTGHFNLNIPLNPIALNRIEFMGGHGSSSHGSGAIGGVINIVPGYYDKSVLRIYGGDYQSAGLDAVVNSQNSSPLKKMVAFSARQTGNYHEQTDSKLYSISSKVTYKNLDFNTGYLNKEFGAYDFYTPFWEMDSREYNEALFLNLKYNYESKSGLIISPKVLWRKHVDRFLLKAEDPDFFENNHINDLISFYLDVKQKGISFGGEFKNTFLDSGSMGEHVRNISSVYGELTDKITDNLSFSAGLRYEDIVIPRFSLEYWPHNKIKLRSSYSGIYRRPTYTELYYSSPANTGNRDLGSETGDSYEFGSDIYLKKDYSLNLTYYKREITDVIDWVGDTVKGPWRSLNTGKLITDAFKISSKKVIGNIHLSIGYIYSFTEKENVYFSKYALNYLRQRLIVDTSYNLPMNFRISVFTEYGEPEGNLSNSFLISDLIIDKSFNNMNLFIKINNIGNSDYSDYPGVPASPMWFTAGLTRFF